LVTAKPKQFLEVPISFKNIKFGLKKKAFVKNRVQSGILAIFWEEKTLYSMV
jgi:hypothetical protein